MAIVSGGSTTFTVTLTTVLSATGFDRLLTVHTAYGANANAVTFDKYNGSVGLKLANAVVTQANDIRDFGPWFFGSTESLRGGAATSSGDLNIDELRV